MESPKNYGGSYFNEEPPYNLNFGCAYRNIDTFRPTTGFSPARTLLTYSGVKRSTILTSFLVKWSDTSALPRVRPVPKTGVLLTRTRVR